MAQNLASKYSKKVDERFKLGPQTNGVVNKGVRLSWSGVQTVSVYDVDTVDMQDYNRTGTGNRYNSSIANLGTGKTDYTLSRDRSFGFIIDKGDYTDSQMVTEAGKSLRRQIDEVIVPELDTWRLAQFAVTAGGALTGAGTGGTKQTGNNSGTDTSSSNAYTILLDAGVELDEAKVPQDGRVAFVSPTFYKNIKLDDNFIKASDLAQKTLMKGQVGEVDGVAIVKVPKSHLPAFKTTTAGDTQVDMIMVHKKASVSPTKFADYKIHQDPPGISGWQVEGRIYYDCFVLSQKNKAISIHYNAAA